MDAHTDERKFMLIDHMIGSQFIHLWRDALLMGQEWVRLIQSQPITPKNYTLIVNIGQF